MILQEYINNNLKKDFIRLLIFSVSALILFVKKKDSILKLYINYKTLNYLTIKNLLNVTLQSQHTVMHAVINNAF